ncbi:ChaN family lipoprotein [Pseudothauera nasutitermitis]|nr:ChaN family lipoprotein [Pseudothauera nasutitermitis]
MKATALFALLLLTACMSAGPAGGRTSGPACVPDAAWVAPGGGELQRDALLGDLTGNGVVLLGERHDSMAHHRWQLETLAALYARHKDMVIGLEMFPRRVQPALDAWVAGELDEAAFLERSDWARVWNHDAALYLDIFRFARDHRIPLRALNVERTLVRAVGRAGYDGVPAEQREGVGRPAEPAAAYVDWLHAIRRAHHPDGAADDDAARRRFVEAQLMWDRAMAEGIAAVRAERPGALVVGLIGGGHLRHGWGVPHQLASLGVTDAAVLLPWDHGSDCAELVAGLATAVYGIGLPAGHPPVPARRAALSTPAG